MRLIRRLVAVAAAAALTACASAGGAQGNSVQHNVVTAAELAPMANVSLFDALNRIRPSWFRSRNVVTPSNPVPVPVHIYVNGVLTEGPDALKLIQADRVQQVRFYEPQDANTRFGTDNNGGAMNVTLKP